MKSVLRKLIALIAIASQFLVFPPKTDAIASLDNPKDVISNISPGAFGQHSISFGMPIGAYAPIRPSDYIIIVLEGFTNVTEPTYIAGTYSGTPSWSIAGTLIRVTGISVALGKTVSINGITANNPQTAATDFNIRIMISNDVDGTSIRHLADAITMQSNGEIIVSAAKEGEIGAVRITGEGSPGMFITFTEGGNTIGTTTAGTTGYFTQVFPGLAPIEHTILIYGIDADNKVTPTVVVDNILPILFTVVTEPPVLMPPTISIDKDSIQRGQSIHISGRGTPNHKTVIFTQPPLNSFETDVGNDGTFNYDFSDTADLDYGDHEFYSIQQSSLGAQSHQSQMLFFRVASGSEQPPGGDAACDISRGNLDCDSGGAVNLTDFSILLYYWGTNNAAADINSDGNVNLIDFSIMMFYWQG